MALNGLRMSQKQLESFAHADADASKGRVNIWHGAVRSGKTVGSLLAFLVGVANAPEQGEIVVIGRTRDTIFRNLIGPLQDNNMYGVMAQHVRYNRGAPTADIFGRTVHVIGASDVRAEAAIRGMTVCLAYVDETTLVAEEFFNQLVARMSVPGARIFTTTNPDGPRNWLKTGLHRPRRRTRAQGVPLRTRRQPGIPSRRIHRRFAGAVHRTLVRPIH